MANLKALHSIFFNPRQESDLSNLQFDNKCDSILTCLSKEAIYMRFLTVQIVNDLNNHISKILYP
jgi:hypothetical protein